MIFIRLFVFKLFMGYLKGPAPTTDIDIANPSTLILRRDTKSFKEASLPTKELLW